MIVYIICTILLTMAAYFYFHFNSRLETLIVVGIPFFTLQIDHWIAGNLTVFRTVVLIIYSVSIILYSLRSNRGQHEL